MFWTSNNAKVYIGRSFLRAHGGLGTDFTLRVVTPGNNTNSLFKVLPRLKLEYCSSDWSVAQISTQNTKRPQEIVVEAQVDSRNKKRKISAAKTENIPQSYLECQPCQDQDRVFGLGTLGSICSQRTAKEFDGRRFGLNI